jgi:hypothetical protein
MGHVRLGSLPKTRRWNQVVSLIAGRGDVEGIAAASATAAENGLERASQDEGLAHAFWLLTQIPQAAREDNFSERLLELDLHVSNEPTLLEIVAAFMRAVDRHVGKRGKRTDLPKFLAHLNARNLPSARLMDRPDANVNCEIEKEKADVETQPFK